jgi:iron complex outermembrane receptor protein
VKACIVLAVLCGVTARARAEPPPAPAGDGAPIEVLAHGTPIDRRADPTPASYVLRGELLEAPGRSTAEALALVPGVQTARAGGGADLATASVRGATSAQTPIYLAGVRLNDDVTGTVDLSTLPLWMIDRVEIYRGHAPASADRLGVGGAIFLEPRRPTRTRFGAAVGGGSFGAREARLGLALAHGQAGGAMLAVRHHAARDDFDYLDDGGTAFDASDDVERPRMNSDHAELDVWSVGALALGRRRDAPRLRMVVNGFARQAGAPGLQRIAATLARVEQERALAGVAVELPCARDAERCAVEVGGAGLFARYRLDDEARELGPSRRTLTEGGRASERLGAHFAPMDGLVLGVGAGHERERIAVDGEGGALVRAGRTLVRGRAHALVEPAPPVEIVLVGTLECHATEGPGAGDEACGVLLPAFRVGARVALAAPLELRANVGRSARVPTLGELYGVTATVRGNPALEPERATTVDAGLAFALGGAAVAPYAQLFGFGRFAGDLIAYRRSSLGTAAPYNVASARVLGLELVLGARVLELAHASVALTALDPRDTTDDRTLANDVLPLQSRLVVAPSFELVSPRWRALGLDRAGAAVRYLHRSERFADPAGLVVLGAESRLDLEATLAFFAERLGVRARLANVLDQRSFDLLGHPLPGRAGYVLAESWW